MVENGSQIVPNITKQYVTTYFTQVAYNTIPINFPVLKGSFIMIDSNATLAIDPTESLYPDVYLTSTTPSKMKNITKSNYHQRLYVDFVYVPYIVFNVSHTFPVPDVYSLVLTLPGSTIFQSIDVSINPRN